MPIETFSWSALGYRKLGQLTESGLNPERLAERIIKLGSYELKEGGWIRRFGRKKSEVIKPYIQHDSTIGIETILDDKALSVVEQFADSDWENMEVPRLRTDAGNLETLIDQAYAVEEKARQAYRINQALNYAGSNRLKPLIRDHVIPWFFNTYPNGLIKIFHFGTELDSDVSLIRVLYAGSLSPLEQLSRESFTSIGVLRVYPKSRKSVNLLLCLSLA